MDVKEGTADGTGGEGLKVMGGKVLSGRRVIGGAVAGRDFVVGGS